MTAPIGSSPVSGTGATATNPTNQLGEQAFLQLLIAELKNQDPNQPMDGTTFITQLAQLNQTQAAMQGAQYQQENLAASLIGKTVTGAVQGKPLTGNVTGFAVNGSTVTLAVNGQIMNVTDVTQVGTVPAPSTQGGSNA